MHQQHKSVQNLPLWPGDPAFGAISLADFVALAEALSRLESEDSSEEENAR